MVHLRFRLQDALLGHSRPIAVRATLYDVRRSAETFYLLLRSEEDSFFLKLRATPEQVSTILKQGGSSMYDEYSVIVQVGGVDRAEFKGKAEADPDVGTRVEVDFSDTVVVTGDCVALEFLDGLRRENLH